MKTETELREYLAELKVARTEVNAWFKASIGEKAEQEALTELSFLEGQIQTIKWILGEESTIIFVPRS